MEIARAAAGLFVNRGLRATRAEDIAQAAGIAPRTFYRYFATKEEAVAPLYAAGADRWAEAVREAPPGLPVPEALEHAVRHTLVPGRVVSASSWEWVRTLIRLAGTSPALGKVWAEVCHTSEATLAEVLVGRAEHVEQAEEAEQAEHTEEAEEAGGAEEAEEGVAVGPHQLFAAAVVSAAVRVAVESWAATDLPPSGAQGPAERALRNLRALRGFAWAEGDTGTDRDADRDAGRDAS
ncbi:TetR family transcriptional regulator [Streptomyces sp. Amel2xC10]|uniref:TetR family transcriptional regulator n=1 Tax=Streptomyces sp. Amel2xC10 TaxID=1305826 RepID=UPI000A16BA4C|nr:TetR family transcriptional regulator [Streptomyces sp. Amel2xC10]